MFKIYISYKRNNIDITPSVMLTYTLIYHCYNVFLRVNNRIPMNFKQ